MKSSGSFRQARQGALTMHLVHASPVVAMVAGGVRIAADVVDFVAVPPSGGAKAILSSPYAIFRRSE
jgi:hypothetical protein